MHNLGVKLMLTGIFVIVLSGLEKVLIFMSFQGRVTDSISLKALTPSVIWNVTTSTLTFGIVLFVIGVFAVIGQSKFYKQSVEKLKEENKKFKAMYESENRNE